MDVNIVRVDIEIANPVIFELLWEHEEIINADRHLHKHEKLPSCQISITKTQDDYRKGREAILLHFNIPMDSRWFDMFPPKMAEINPYLRFAMKTDKVSAKKYRHFEKTMIKEQDKILKNYAGFYFQLSELRNNDVSLYDNRKQFRLKDGIILYCETKLDQDIHKLSDADVSLNCGQRKLYTFV